MKKVLFLMFGLFFFVWGTASVNAQVRVGENTAPRAGAILDLKSSSYIGGLLLPNVDITDPGSIPDTFTDAASIADRDNCPELTGLLVWNTHSGSEGVYMWDGADWKLQKVGSGAGGSCLGVPAEPTWVSFSPDAIAPGSTTVATCEPVADANFYYWNLAAGLSATTLVTTTNSLIITGVNSGSYGPGSVKVRVSNECGMNCGYGTQSGNTLTVVIGGLTPIGISSGCNTLNYGKCVCSTGRLIWYRDAHQIQRDATALTEYRYWGDGARNGYWFSDGAAWHLSESPSNPYGIDGFCF